MSLNAKADQTEEAGPLPPVRPDLKLYPSSPTVDGSPTWVIYDPVRHRYFNIGAMECEMLRHWEGQTAVSLAEHVGKTGLAVHPLQVEQLKEFLSRHQLIRIDTEEAVNTLVKQVKKMEHSIKMNLLQGYLFLRIPLWHPDRFLRATLPFVRPLMSRTFFIITLFAVVLGIFLVSRQWDTFIRTFPYFFTWQGVLSFVIALSFAKIIHELGHAYVATRLGLRVSTIGVAFIVLWPVLYTDTSDAWRLTSRHKRVWIDAAGIGAELTLAVYALLLWNFLPDGPIRSAAFMIAAVTWIMTVLININPCMKFDGYYLFSDSVGINNLQERGFAVGRWWMREKLFALGDKIPEPLPRRRVRIMLLYAYTTWVYRFFLFLGIAALVYYMFFKVIGLFLMIVEIIWFIVRPIAKEMTYWYSRKNDMHWNLNTTATALAFIALLAALIIPWQSGIQVPAVYRSESVQRIYPPLPAQIESIHVENGRQVKAGDLLFTLKDDKIAYDLEQALRRREQLQLQLDLQAADRTFLEQIHVVATRLAETEAQITSYREQQENLLVRAPFAGEISDMANGLRAGMWVNPELMLAVLGDKSSDMITAYVSEDDMAEIQSGNAARFYPKSLELKPFETQVSEVDRANIAQLQTIDHYVASTYGGKLGVRETENHAQVPNKATYRVRLKVQKQAYSPLRVYPGTVILQTTQAQSLLERFFTLVYAVIIRESGF